MKQRRMEKKNYLNFTTYHMLFLVESLPPPLLCEASFIFLLQRRKTKAPKG